MRIREIDLADLCVVLALAAALLLTIGREQQELAMSIAGGLMGYIGGSSRGMPGQSRAAPRCPLGEMEESKKEEEK